MKRARRSGAALVATLLLPMASACAGGDGSAGASAEPFATDSGFVRSGDARLFYRTLGSGSPVIVLHGGPGLEHSYLLPGLEPLARDRRLIFYDQRASGRSDAPLDSTSLSLDRFLADLDRIRETLGGERVTLLGHSWGGLLSMLYAAEHPNRVRSLVLMGSIEPGHRYRAETGRRQRSRQSAADSAAIAELVRSDAFRARERQAVNRLYRLSFRSTFADPALADRLPVDFTERTARGAGILPALLLGSLGDYDFWDEVHGIDAPTLVVHGAQDPIPPAMARALADTIPDARFVEIPRAGHFPFVEAPDTLFSAIGRFLDEREEER